MKRTTLTIRVEGRDVQHIGKMMDVLSELHPVDNLTPGKDYKVTADEFTACMRIDVTDPPLPAPRRCAKCGRPENAHDVRHRFVSV